VAKRVLLKNYDDEALAHLREYIDANADWKPGTRFIQANPFYQIIVAWFEPNTKPERVVWMIKPYGHPFRALTAREARVWVEHIGWDIGNLPEDELWL
jgi:hypothetical protein